MRNNTYIRFETICKNFKGYIGTKELLAEGFSNRQIAVLLQEGYLQKVCYGYYWLEGKQLNKPRDYKGIEVCLSAPEAIICMKSALYYQGILKQEPEFLAVATRRGDRRLLNMQYPIQRHYFSESNFEMGIEKRRTEFGDYNIYNIERCICDLVRLDHEINVEIINKMQTNIKSYDRLIKYAQLLNIKKLS